MNVITMQRFILTIVFLLLPFFVLSQNFERSVFRLIGKELSRWNRNIAIKQELKDVFLLEDPGAGGLFIGARDTLEKGYIAFKRKYSKVQQIEILSSEALPIFPLKDTLIVVDTVKVLTDRFYKHDGIVFSVVNSPIDTNTKGLKTQIIYLYKVGFRDSSLLFAFTLKDIKKYLCFEFNLDTLPLAFKRVYLVDISQVHE